METKKKFFTPREAAEILGLCPETVRSRVRRGQIPVLRGFGKILIPAEWFSFTSVGSGIAIRPPEEDE